jgi:hypothetical protein
LNKDSNLNHCKRLINDTFTQLKAEKKYSGIIIVADVDPM